MKKIIALALVCVVGLALAACSGGGGAADMKADKPLDDIAAEIREAVVPAMMMKEEDVDILKEYYGYDLEKYAGYAIYNPMMINSDTIHIVEVTDIDDLSAAMEELEANKQRIIQSFEQYLPEPYEMAQNGQVVSKGRYAMLIISSDNETATEIFNNSIS